MGQFDFYFADVVLRRADGAIIPIWTGNAAASSLTATVSGPGTATSVSLSVGPPPGSNAGATGTHYYLADQLGTTQMELSNGGWPLWIGQFSPFGQELETGSTSMHYKFTGKERDSESGLDYFGARYYGSSMGRFMSPDYEDEDDGPVSIPYYNPSNPQSLNLYSYVHNNPLTKSDADGHDVQVCSADSNGNQQCSVISNSQYQAAQQATNAQGVLNVPSLTNVGANGTSNITDSSGNTVGTATYIPDSGVDFYSNQGAYAQLSNTSKVVTAGTAIYAGAYSAAFLGPMAYTALTGGAESAGAGPTEHAAERLAERGISPKQAQDAIEAAKKAGDVVTKMGKYGTPQSIYTANGIRVVVEQAGANAGKIITAFFK